MNNNEDSNKRMAWVPLEEYNELVEFRNKVGTENLVLVTRRLGYMMDQIEFLGTEDAIKKLKEVEQSRIDELIKNITEAKKSEDEARRKINQVLDDLARSKRVLDALKSMSVFQFMTWRKGQKQKEGK